jgi:hypothetical protein
MKIVKCWNDAGRKPLPYQVEHDRRKLEVEFRKRVKENPLWTGVITFEDRHYEVEP